VAQASACGGFFPQPLSIRVALLRRYRKARLGLRGLDPPGRPIQAVDNQMDQAAGTVKLKAMFDNRNGALFPNEFVTGRLLLSTP
jgi:hypothetical protein